MNDQYQTQTPRSGKPGKWKSVLLGLVILCSGIIIGAGLTGVFIHTIAQNAIRHPEIIPEHAAERMRKKLSLTEDQTRTVKRIMIGHQKNIQEIRREFQPRIDAELDGVRDEVSAVLGPEKAAKWTPKFDELRKLWLPPPAAAARTGS
jgi:hypothetical protein